MAPVGGPGALRGRDRIGELGCWRFGDRRGVSGCQVLAQAVGARKSLLRREADNRGVASPELDRAGIATALLLDAPALFFRGRGGFCCPLHLPSFVSSQLGFQGILTKL